MIVLAVAEKANIKEKGLGKNPTLGLVLVVLQGYHLSLLLGYPRLCFIARPREPLQDECGLG